MEDRPVVIEEDKHEKVDRVGRFEFAVRPATQEAQSGQERRVDALARWLLSEFLREHPEARRW